MLEGNGNTLIKCGCKNRNHPINATQLDQPTTKKYQSIPMLEIASQTLSNVSTTKRSWSPTPHFVRSTDLFSSSLLLKGEKHQENVLGMMQKLKCFKFTNNCGAYLVIDNNQNVVTRSCSTCTSFKQRYDKHKKCNV